MSAPVPVRPADSPRRVFRLPILLPWLIAGALAVACAWLGRLQLSSQAQRALLADQQRLAELELRGVRQQLEAERILNRRQLTDTASALTQKDQQLAEVNRRAALLAQTSDEATRRLSAANAQLAALRERLRTHGDLAQLRIATLKPPAGGAFSAAVVVWNASRQEGVLQAESLPAPAPGHDYQLWVTDPAYAHPVDGGVFAFDSVTGNARVNFRPNKPVRTATAFAIRLEKKGGAAQAEGPIVLLSE